MNNLNLINTFYGGSGGLNMAVLRGLRAAAYARYSDVKKNRKKDKQKDTLTIAMQFKKIAEFCEEYGINLIAQFKDEGETGTNTDRDDFESLCYGAKNHDFDVVVIYDITRGSRDVVDWFSFRKEMRTLGLPVLSATEKLGDITNPSDFLTELITVGIGQHHVLQTRLKTIDAIAELAEKGKFCGGTPPLGYDIVDGNYVINEREAETVRKIFTMYATGASYNNILDAVKSTRGKRGQSLGKNSLYSILRNERYIGTYSWNKRKMKLFRKWAGGAPNPNCVRIENFIPPIIDIPVWEKVQKRMDNRKRNAANKAKRNYLLSGLIECEACGAAYVGHTSTNSKGYETRYYCCGDKYRNRTCQSKNINANEIETFVVQNLKAYFLATNFEEAAQFIADQVNCAAPNLKKERAELKSIETKINNGVAAILSGTKIPELDAELDRLRVRKSELEDIIARRHLNITKVKPEAIVKLFQSAIENWNDENLPQIIKQHVTKIYAHADGSYTVNVGVHIVGCGGRI